MMVMKAMAENAKRTSPTPVGQAFTLVELLVVIVIIVVLIGILAPAIMRAMNMIEVAKTQARIAELSQAINSFHEAKTYYPGQRDRDLWSGTYTGSQVLAANLFDYDYASITALAPLLSHRFVRPLVEYTYTTVGGNAVVTGIVHRKSGLFDPRQVSTDFSQDARPNSISDLLGTRPMAILYYPSRETAVGLNQYVMNDNLAYLVPATTSWSNATFQQYITDTRSGSAPYNQGRFLLIGAGVDRRYGTTDDVKNW
jgi:prepilin-type N-terminal cleavage/methylation domain-containing protein